MRPRFHLLALLAAVALLLAVAGCSRDPRPGQGVAQVTTTAAAPATTAPAPASRPQTTRPVPSGVVPAGHRQPAPDLHVTAFDGRTVTLGAFRGQPVVVNFFESW
jgi:cytochrome oxidase Cu insertion factor (SCO1/SenC/PrrC family)